MTDGLNILEALQHIDPARLDYQQWTNVGMALKQEGYPPDAWEQWSARDPARYHPGECLKKWQSFNGSTQPVTGGTIIQYALDQGWKPLDGADGEIGWDDVIGGHERDELQVLDTAWVEEQDIPKPPEPFDGVKQLIRYLSLLFEAAETVGYVTQSYTTEDGRRVPTKGSYDRTAGQLIEALNKCGGDIGAALGDYDPDTGAWIRFNPLDGKGVKNENVTEYRYALVESDTLALSRQYSLMLELRLPIAVLVHSGGKSIHAIVRIDAENYDEYRKRVDYLYAVCQKNGMQIDRQNRNPSRLSRMPGVTRKGKPQYILAENIGCESFAAWREYIESVNDDLPDVENLADVWDNMPPLAPELIQGVLRKGHKMLLSGPSKAGKSYALIELCIAIAEGMPWMGIPCAQGKVLYVNLEVDTASSWDRIKQVYTALNIPPLHTRSIDVWNLRGRSCPMDKLTPKLIRRAKQKGYAAVIIDPIYKVITGDENSADQMAAFCNQFDRICTELGCSIIYCHHHSKGSQGQKSSMDRASGSGVFARDPDALLDLIELQIPPQTRDEIVNRATRDVALKWLQACLPDWREQISQDDECSHVRLLSACQKLLSPQTVQAMQHELLPRQDNARTVTGWRLEGVLREFKPFTPRYLWFIYPTHREDASGTLKDLYAQGEKKSRGTPQQMHEGRKKQAEDQYEAKRIRFENALQLANGGEPCTVAQIGEYLSMPDRTVRDWVRNYGYKIDKNQGNIIIKKDGDGGEQ